MPTPFGIQFKPCLLHAYTLRAAWDDPAKQIRIEPPPTLKLFRLHVCTLRAARDDTAKLSEMTYALP